MTLFSKVLAMKRAKPATVDEYMESCPQPQRAMLERIRALVRSLVPPEATEVISYRIPAFKYKGMLVWYAAFAEHCSLFPGSSVLHAFKDDLKNYSVSKGTIRFPIDKPLPTTLVKKLVKAKIAENEERKRR